MKKIAANHATPLSVGVTVTMRFATISKDSPAPPEDLGRWYGRQLLHRHRGGVVNSTGEKEARLHGKTASE